MSLDDYLRIVFWGALAAMAVVIGAIVWRRYSRRQQASPDAVEQL